MQVEILNDCIILRPEGILEQVFVDKILKLSKEGDACSCIRRTVHFMGNLETRIILAAPEEYSTDGD